MGRRRRAAIPGLGYTVRNDQMTLAEMAEKMSARPVIGVTNWGGPHRAGRPFSARQASNAGPARSSRGRDEGRCANPIGPT